MASSEKESGKVVPVLRQRSPAQLEWNPHHEIHYHMATQGLATAMLMFPNRGNPFIFSLSLFQSQRYG